MAKTQTAAPAAPAPQPPAAPATTAIARFQALRQLPRLTVDDFPYAYLDMVRGGAGADVLSAFQQNLGGQTLSTFDFTRIKVPSGDTRAWQVISPETGEETY